ncbi:MAG: 3-oxoacyl-[acyl-carrier-protein] reductase [Armatimonadota bacterium]|nr:3-oxoacyl-[acyl-carrier-protein] reductase [Armatimonadota bacterium]MDR7453595.1 3-oxoacyl-[acyl-carrier-protein] reductase [Armatimonadota bacterium]MDR7456925.1 3-oxoacyl-[acyl-carrier-protein] reductase [Armatimonadota bacterium]MDR7496769.1 3-oxoacyl-[acyl-carrier-protein] reductase [Armatimonadota bacterium]MDR7511226.1 3-oxoacyl-[acyl-carrier-protein] reductase [Armatimonadota bacterium]
MRLRDRVAVVTGASGGIGRRIATALAQEGAAVVAHYWRSADAARALVAEIEAAGGRAHAVGGDLANPEEASAVVAAAAATFGQLDILVNNAGLARDGLVLRMSDDAWRAVLDANLSGAFFCIRAALRDFLRQRRGRIINITSTAGQVGNAGQANYVAAKAGLIGLTRAVAREVGSRGITVNAVAPGFIDAGMTGGLPEEIVARYMAQIPLGRAGSPEDVAAAVVFLASEEAAYITGQVLNVDGGMVMH